MSAHWLTRKLQGRGQRSYFIRVRYGQARSLCAAQRLASARTLSKRRRQSAPSSRSMEVRHRALLCKAGTRRAEGRRAAAAASQQATTLESSPRCLCDCAASLSLPMSGNWSTYAQRRISLGPRWSRCCPGRGQAHPTRAFHG